MKYIIKGWVEVEVYAELEAKNIHEARKIWENTHGSGYPDKFMYEEGDWCSPVKLESITRKTKTS